MIIYSQTENSYPELPKIQGYKPQFRYQDIGGNEEKKEISVSAQEQPTQKVIVEEPTSNEWSDIRSIIKRNEGFIGTAKKSFNEPNPTVGYGFFNTLPDGTKITDGMVLTKAQADRQLDIAIANLSNKVQNSLDSYSMQVSPEQFNILLDLGYHGGAGLVDKLLRESNGDINKIGSLLNRYATKAKYGDTSINNVLKQRALRRVEGWNKYTLKGKNGLKIPKFQNSGIVKTPQEILKENKGINDYIARFREPYENTYDFVNQRNLRYDPESENLKIFFKSYVNSEGFNRILNNQNNWYNERYPNRKIIFPSNIEKLDRKFKSNVENDNTRMFLLNGNPDRSEWFGKPDASFRFEFPGEEETESISNDFVAAHEYAHSKDWGTYKNAQEKALDQNKNTKKNKHDEYKREKHSDVWGLKYLLYKKRIYDSRGNEDATPEHIEQLRKLYPELRPLQQMSNEEAAWMINNVAYNNKLKFINLGKNGLKVPKFQKGGISPEVINTTFTNLRQKIADSKWGPRIAQELGIKQKEVTLPDGSKVPIVGGIGVMGLLNSKAWEGLEYAEIAKEAIGYNKQIPKIPKWEKTIIGYEGPIKKIRTGKEKYQSFLKGLNTYTKNKYKSEFSRLDPNEQARIENEYWRIINSKR